MRAACAGRPSPTVSRKNQAICRAGRTSPRDWWLACQLTAILCTGARAWLPSARPGKLRCSILRAVSLTCMGCTSVSVSKCSTVSSPADRPAVLPASLPVSASCWPPAAWRGAAAFSPLRERTPSALLLELLLELLHAAVAAPAAARVCSAGVITVRPVHSRPGFCACSKAGLQVCGHDHPNDAPSVSPTFVARTPCARRSYRAWHVPRAATGDPCRRAADHRRTTTHVHATRPCIRHACPWPMQRLRIN